MQSLETEYKGYKFRSRLEARWAVFFDICKVRYEYEPEGYDLGDDIFYLPDFLLHNVTIITGDENYKTDLYVEIKGKMTDLDLRKVSHFYMNENYNIVNRTIILGDIPHAKKIADIYKIFADDDSLEKYFFKFLFIDWDSCGAYPCLDKKENFIILDERKLQSRIMDFRATQKAYKFAKHINFKYIDCYKDFWRW